MSETISWFVLAVVIAYRIGHWRGALSRNAEWIHEFQSEHGVNVDGRYYHVLDADRWDLSGAKRIGARDPALAVCGPENVGSLGEPVEEA